MQLSEIDELLSAAVASPVSRVADPVPAAPARKLVVLTCMDARVDPNRILGLADGEAHVIRNAGGVASEDAIRSTVISQLEMGTQAILLMHHTRCGMLALDEEGFNERVEMKAGTRPPWPLHAMKSLEASLRLQAETLREDPFVDPETEIRAAIYDVEQKTVMEVELNA
jgi:carbonic anhydrase